jgi:hypothetical protein
MKNQHFLTLLAACFAIGIALTACASTSVTPAPLPAETENKPAPTLPSPSPTTTLPPPVTTLPPTATITSPPATPTPVPFPLKFPAPGTVVLDFVALACRARWANGAFDLPCPGNLNDLAEGYIAPAEQAVAEGQIPVEAPLLVGLPGLGGEHGAGLFGTYPSLLIQPGDTFNAVVACQDGTNCDVEFALEYIDAQGAYQHGMGWSWQHSYGGGPVPVQVDLSPLAGQTVQLVLVVRDQGTPEDDWVLWVYPYVARFTP